MLQCTKKGREFLLGTVTDSFLPFVVRMVPRTGPIRRQVPTEWTLIGMWAKPFSLSEFFSFCLNLKPFEWSSFRPIDMSQPISDEYFSDNRQASWENHFNRISSCENTISKKSKFLENGNFWGSQRKFRWRRSLDQERFKLLKLQWCSVAKLYYIW